MAISFQLVVCVILSFVMSGIHTSSLVDYDYCVVGAGPGGIVCFFSVNSVFYKQITLTPKLFPF